MDELVSVIMSAFNERKSDLEQSIDSVLAQSYRNIELIVVNDNPENETIRKVLDHYEEVGVVIIHNDHNLGIVKSLNRALAQTKGKYIARMDADDISYGNRIQRQVEYIERNQMDLIGTYAQIVNEEGEKGRVVKLETDNKKIRRKIHRGNQLVHPSWLGRKELFDRLGGYRNIPLCEDYDFLLRAKMLGAKIGNAPFVGVEYRIRSSSISNQNAAKQMAMAMFISNHADKMSERELIQYYESKKFEKKAEQCELYLKDYNSDKPLERMKVFCNAVFYEKVLRAILYSSIF